MHRPRLLLFVLALPILAHATALTFGPVCSNSCTDTPIPSHYGGFTWSSDFYAASNTEYMNLYGNTYGAPSGGAAFNAAGADAVTVMRWNFFFVGAAFTSWASNDAYANFSSTTITIDGYSPTGNLVGTCSATLSPSSYNFVTCNLAPVRTLVFHNDTEGVGRWWLMDDFTYIPAVGPEPGTLVLLGSSALGIFATLRRKLVK